PVGAFVRWCVDGRPVSEPSDESADGPRTYFFGLMIWPAVEELLDANPWTGLSFGSVAAARESRLRQPKFFRGKLGVSGGAEANPHSPQWRDRSRMRSARQVASLSELRPRNRFRHRGQGSRSHPDPVFERKEGHGVG